MTTTAAAIAATAHTSPVADATAGVAPNAAAIAAGVYWIASKRSARACSVSRAAYANAPGTPPPAHSVSSANAALAIAAQTSAVRSRTRAISTKARLGCAAASSVASAPPTTFRRS